MYLEAYEKWKLDPNRGPTSPSFDDMAKRVGISKKTLDDYYIQIRLGYFSGFNFLDIEGKDMGHLRRHNLRFKKKMG